MAHGKARLWRCHRPGDRKKYYRNKGLAIDAFRAEVEDRKAKRCAALVQLQGWLGFGIGEVMGSRCYITVPKDRAPAAVDRIQQLRAQGKLAVCKGPGGSPCLGLEWARVMVNGVVIEVIGKVES